MVGLLDMPSEILSLIYAHLSAMECFPQSFIAKQRKTCAPICRSLLPYTRAYKLTHLRFRRPTIQWTELIEGLLTPAGSEVRSIHIDMPALSATELVEGPPFVGSFDDPRNWLLGMERIQLEGWEFPEWTKPLVRLAELMGERGVDVTGAQVQRVLEAKARYEKQFKRMTNYRTPWPINHRKGAGKRKVTCTCEDGAGRGAKRSERKQVEETVSAYKEELNLGGLELDRNLAGHSVGERVG